MLNEKNKVIILLIFIQYIDVIVRICFFFAGIPLPQRKRCRGGLPHLRLHKDPPRRIRRLTPLAFCSLRVVHPLWPVYLPREGVQYRGELHPRPHVEELPKAESRTWLSRLWISQVCLAWNAEKEAFHEGWHHVHKSKSRPEQDCCGMNAASTLVLLISLRFVHSV